MLYLAKIELTISRYMAERYEKREKIHLVEADSEDAVENKIRAYYDAKNEEYNISYWVNIDDITELIK